MTVWRSAALHWKACFEASQVELLKTEARAEAAEKECNDLRQQLVESRQHAAQMAVEHLNDGLRSDERLAEAEQRIADLESRIAALSAQHG